MKVARELFALEQAIDAALVQAAGLSAVMPTATAEANLSAIVIQDAFERSAATFAALAKARRHVVETHHCLTETKTQIGLRTMSFGGEDKPPIRPTGQATETQENKVA